MAELARSLRALAVLVLAVAAVVGWAGAARACDGFAATDKLTITPFVLAEGMNIRLAGRSCEGARATFVFRLGADGDEVATATATGAADRVDVRFRFARALDRATFGLQADMRAQSAALFDVKGTKLAGGGRMGDRTGAKLRYPYDWTAPGKRPAREAESIIPGFSAGGLNIVYDTPRLGQIAVSAKPGRITGLFPYYSEYNRQGDRARARHRLKAGTDAHMRLYFHAGLAHIQDRRFGKPARKAMAGRALTQFVPRFWAPSPGVIDRAGLKRDPTGRYCGGADRGRGRVCFPTADEMRAFASAVPKTKSGAPGIVIARVALPRAETARAIRNGGASPHYYLFFGAVGFRDADPTVKPGWILTDSAGKPHMAPNSTRSRGNWLLLDLTQKAVRDFYVGRALEALDAGYEGIFMDGGFLWNMPNGMVGGDNPNARISQNHARHLLLRELRQEVKRRHPKALIGILANRYMEYMHHADYVSREGTALHWKPVRALPHERVVVFDPRYRSAKSWHARYGRLAQSPVIYACKGPSAVLVRSCRMAVDLPKAGYYYDSGDWHIYDSEIAASLLKEIYGPGDLYITRTENDARIVAHGVSRLAFDEGGGRVWFSRQAPLLDVGAWRPVPRVSHLYSFKAGVDYTPADRRGPGDWSWARHGFLYRDNDAYAAGDFYILTPPTENAAGDLTAYIAPTFRIDVQNDTRPGAFEPPADREMTVRLRLPPGAGWRLTDLAGAPLRPNAVERADGMDVVTIESDGPVRLTVRGL